MTDNELLHGISDLLDHKLQPLKDDIQGLKDDVAGLKGLKADVAELKDDVLVLKADVTYLKNDMQVLIVDVAYLKIDVAYLKDGMQSVNDNLHQLRLCQENLILPRLTTIESCYMDTYNRYKCYCDKMDYVFTDVGLLKETVSAHSEKLQKLA